jgi:AraC family transcriptional regulator
MNSNLRTISNMIETIEDHLTEDITLDDLAQEAGYSKYHLHRMFSGLVGFSVHQYIRRRRLTEAARQLLFSHRAILDIAIAYGYASQQAFTLAFKEMYKLTPQQFRKRHQFYPMQLKFDLSGNIQNLKGDRMMDVEVVERGEIILAGLMANTKKGFFVIPRLWNKMHKMKNKIPNRNDMDHLIALNDYSRHFSYEENQPAFDYYAAVEVSQAGELPAKMTSITLPAGKYVVFTYHGKNQDSMEPVVDYIYKEWFPQSDYQLNENARYDFVRHNETTDAEGKSKIEVWVPII